jgi:membrane-associated phospholipid phosphatase
LLEFFYSIDKAVFYFFNHTLQNPVFDAIMPFLTDLNKNKPALVAVGLLWALLIWKGGRAGRIAGLLLIPTIVLSDQLNSSWLKSLFGRIRPCHVLTDVHLLVPCGSGLSFPSSHAVNNFAGAVVMSAFLPKWTWAFMTFAALVAISRVFVGVHYPFDILVGAAVGAACGSMVVVAYRLSERWWTERRQQRMEEAP